MKQISTVKEYIFVYVFLMILLGLTLGSAFLDLGALNPVLNLSIAGVKAALVLIFFMHLKGSGNLTKVFAAAGLFWLGILFTLALTDYLSRSWMLLPGRWP